MISLVLALLDSRSVKFSLGSMVFFFFNSDLLHENNRNGITV